MTKTVTIDLRVQDEAHDGADLPVLRATLCADDERIELGYPLPLHPTDAVVATTRPPKADDAPVVQPARVELLGEILRVGYGIRGDDTTPDIQRSSEDAVGLATAGEDYATWLTASSKEELAERLVCGLERHVLWTMYSGAGSMRQIARTRIIGAWALAVLRSLSEGTECMSRADRLAGLIASDGVPAIEADPARKVPPAPEPEDYRKESRILVQIYRYLRFLIRNGRQAPSTKKIIVHPFRNRWAIFEEINASIALTTFMTAGSFVFLGLVLDPNNGASRTPSMDTTATINTFLDVIFLFICSFGFLFATLAYANASGELSRSSTTGYQRALERGNRISEYIGVFPLVFVIPVTVARLLPEPLPSIVGALAIAFMLSYLGVKDFALIGRDLAGDKVGNTTRRWLHIIWVVLMMAGTYYSQGLGAPEWVRLAAAAAFAATALWLFALSMLVPEDVDPSVYTVHLEDTVGEESPSFLDEARVRDPGPAPAA